ncbi:hypothetical protein E2C01_010190 [Portunus trituberculatus]|uniref:Uncharacterized protein n=1 Tax=Portunus trituberculatus TaxID=210409 RepID=A0A5B7D7Q3_PORTR|nr:hypothetical protein [Portunus trituberculatus]
MGVWVREYVEAKLQRRALESNNIYRRQGSDGTAPATENGTHRSAESLATRTDHLGSHPSRPGPIGAAKSCNGVRSRLCSQPPRLQDLTREDMTRADVKALQKEAVLSYIKIEGYLGALRTLNTRAGEGHCSFNPSTPPATAVSLGIVFVSRCPGPFPASVKCSGGLVEVLKSEREPDYLFTSPEKCSDFRVSAPGGGSVVNRSTNKPQHTPACHLTAGLPDTPQHHTALHHITTYPVCGVFVSSAYTLHPCHTLLPACPVFLLYLFTSLLSPKVFLLPLQSRVSPSKGSSSPNSPNASFDSGDSAPSFPSGAPPSITTSLHHTTTSQHPTTAATTTSHPPHYSSSPYSNNLYHSSPHHGSRGGGGGSAPTTAKTNAAPTTTTATTVKTRKRSGGGRPFDPDAAHLSFTYRRELEKQQHEKQLVENLRNNVIERS